MAAAFGAVAAVTTAGGVLGWAFGWHWGDVPTWVGALATVTALGAAAAGAVGVFKQLDTLADQVQLQRDALALQTKQVAAERAEADRRAAQEIEIRRAELRKQAEDIDIGPAAREHQLQDVNRDVFLVLHVENNSRRPIRQVTCKMILNGDEIAPIETARFVDSNGTWAALDQGRRIPLPILRRHSTIDFVFERAAAVTHGATYALRFTDDADLHWELTDDMRLKQLDDRTDW